MQLYLAVSLHITNKCCLHGCLMHQNAMSLASILAVESIPTHCTLVRFLSCVDQDMNTHSADKAACKLARPTGIELGTIRQTLLNPSSPIIIWCFRSQNQHRVYTVCDQWFLDSGWNEENNVIVSVGRIHRFQSSHFFGCPKILCQFLVNSWDKCPDQKRGCIIIFGNWQINRMEYFPKNKLDPFNLENSRSRVPTKNLRKFLLSPNFFPDQDTNFRD